MYLTSYAHTFSMTNENSSIVAIFGSNVKTYRKRQKMTQEQLAEKTGVTVKYISNIECSISFPSAPVIASIAKALNVPEYSLFTPEEVEMSCHDGSYISKDALRREITKLTNSLLNELK